MSARHRRPGRARRTRHLPRHAAGATYPPVAQLADANLAAFADSLYGPDGRRQAELIAACDVALWNIELGSAP